MLKSLYGMMWFTKHDLKDGFWNISLDPKCKPYTAFVVPKRGLFPFNVLPFDLKISPTLFQTVMENIFMELIKEGTVMVYIDDLIIMSKNIKEHIDIFDSVF